MNHVLDELQKSIKSCKNSIYRIEKQFNGKFIPEDEKIKIIALNDKIKQIEKAIEILKNL